MRLDTPSNSYNYRRSFSKLNFNWSPILFTEGPLPNSIGYVVLALTCMQSLALNFEVADINVTSRLNGEKGTDLSGLLNLILFRRKFAVSSPNSIDILIIIASISYMFLFLVINGIICYAVVKKKVVNNFFPRIWKGWGYIHLFVMSLPLHNLFIDFIYTSMHLSNPPPGPIIGSIISIVLAAINCAFWIIQLKFSFVIKTKDLFSRTNSTYIGFGLLTKTLLSTLNRLTIHLEDQIALKILIVVIGFCCSVTNQALLFGSWPFYKNWINQLFSLIETSNIILSLFAVVFLISNSISEGSASLAILLFGFLLFIGLGIKLNLAFFSLKITQLTPKSFYSKLSLFQTFWLIQRLRFLKTLFSKTLVPDTSEKKFRIQGLLQAGLSNQICSYLLSENGLVTTIPSKKERREYIYQLFYQAISHNPKNSFLRLVLANYLIKDSSQIYKPTILIQQTLSDEDAPVNVKLSAVYLQKRIQETIVKNIQSRNHNIEINSYFYASNIYEEFKGLINHHLTFLEKFYKLLEDRIINSSILTDLSAKLQRSREQIHKYWEKIPYELTEKKGSLYLAYAIFSSCFDYDLETGRNILNKYKSFLRKNVDYYKSNQINNMNLHDSHSMSFLIKGDMNSFGVIVDCSSNVKNILGYSKSVLVGRNFNTLLPAFFQSMFVDLMKSKLESNEELYSLAHIDSFVKGYNGFIIPVKNMLIVYPCLENGLLFWSLMRTLDSDFDYMLVGDNGSIEGVSKKLQNELGINPNERNTINTICPSLGKLERVMEMIYMDRQQNLREDDANRSKYQMDASIFAHANERVFSYKRKTISEKELSLNDGEQIDIAQEVMNRGKVFSFKSRKVETNKKLIPYICKCMIQSHQHQLLKIYVLQKVHVEMPVNSCLSQLTPESAIKLSKMQEHRRKPSSEYNISIDEFENEKGNYYDIPPVRQETKASIWAKTIQDIYSEEVNAKNLEAFKSKSKSKQILKRSTDPSSEIQSELSATPTYNYQPSMKSDVSDARRNGEKLDNLLSSLRFYRFNELKVPFFLILLFLIVLLTTIWLIYGEAVRSIPQIKGTVEVFEIMLTRSNLVYSAMRYNYLIYIANFLPFNITRHAINLGIDLAKLSVYNFQLKEKIDHLEPKTKELFYTENIKIFYGGFDDIKTSNEYSLHDTMGALNAIIAEGLYLTSHATDPGRLSNPRYIYSQDYLYRNMFNDYLLKNEELLGTIFSDLEGKTSNIEKKCTLFITTTATFFAIAVAVLSIVLYLVYRRVCEFLNDFVNGGYDNELPKLVSSVNQFRSLLDSDFDLSQRYAIDQKVSTRSLEKLQKSANYVSKLKSVRSTGIFFHHFSQCVTSVLILTIGLVILVLASVKYKERSQDILPIMNDITQAAEISQHAQAVISIISLYIFNSFAYIQRISLIITYFYSIFDIFSIKNYLL